MITANGKKCWTDLRVFNRLEEAINKKTSIIVFDTETTGTKAATGYIVQISAVKLTPNNVGKYSIADKLDLYIKPPISMPEEASAVNHITDEFLSDKPTEAELFDKIHEYFGDNTDDTIIAGYNVKFDIGFLNALYKRQEGITFEPSEDRIVDVMEMGRALIKREELISETDHTGSFTLSNLCRLFKLDKNIENRGEFHSSIVDTIMTAGLMIKLRNLYIRDFLCYSVLEEAKRPNVKVTAMTRRKYPGIGHDYIFIQCVATVNGCKVYGQIDYNRYSHEYVESRGEIIDVCNLYSLIDSANALAGGDFTKIKVTK